MLPEPVNLYQEKSPSVPVAGEPVVALAAAAVATLMITIPEPPLPPA